MYIIYGQWRQTHFSLRGMIVYPTGMRGGGKGLVKWEIIEYTARQYVSLLFDMVYNYDVNRMISYRSPKDLRDFFPHSI